MALRNCNSHEKKMDFAVAEDKHFLIYIIIAISTPPPLLIEI